MNREEVPSSSLLYGDEVFGVPDVHDVADDNIVRISQAHCHSKTSPSLSTAYSAVPSYSASVPSTAGEERIVSHDSKSKYPDCEYNNNNNNNADDDMTDDVEPKSKKQKIEKEYTHQEHVSLDNNANPAASNISYNSRRDNIIISPYYDCTVPHPYQTYPQDPVAYPQAVDGPMVMSMLSGLKQAEKRFPSLALRGTSPSQRRVIVDWCCELSESAQLNCYTAHLAVRYFDICWFRLVEKKETRVYQGSKLQILMLACLYIACKFYEPTKTMQKFGKKFADTLLYIANVPNCTAVDLNRMERVVLELLTWRMNIPTAAQFVEIITHCGILFQSDMVQDKKPERAHISNLRKYVSFFTELQLQDDSIVHYTPSVASTAILICARRAVGVVPLYNPLLFKTTGIPPEEFYNCYVRLYDFYQKSFGDIDRSANTDVLAFQHLVHQNQKEKLQVAQQQQITEK